MVRIKKRHVFELSRIMRKAKIELPATDDPMIIGKALTILVWNIGDVEKELDKLLANIHNVPVNEVEDLDFDEYITKVMEVAKDPGFLKLQTKLQSQATTTVKN